MTNVLLIVHGYSDTPSSFDHIARNFEDRLGYTTTRIYALDYASMDDQATYLDFADKLNDIYEAELKPNSDDGRIDVICHSTGALVVRGWLALRRMRQKNTGVAPKDFDAPVHRLVMIAPANFGSDLAKAGQKYTSAVFQRFKKSDVIRDGDEYEVGREILQGLEPGSPIQWRISNLDLHNDSGVHTYFHAPREGEPFDATRVTYPFVFTGAETYTGLETWILRKAAKPGTDGTVRIPGTPLNTRRLCILKRKNGYEMEWSSGEHEAKWEKIPFGLFRGVNHSSIVSDLFEVENKRIAQRIEEALQIDSPANYAAFAKAMETATDEEIKGTSKKDKKLELFQQFLFKTTDDVGEPIEDCLITFDVRHVSNEQPHAKLTEELGSKVELDFSQHSTTKSHRAMMLSISEASKVLRKIRKDDAKIIMTVEEDAGARSATNRLKCASIRVTAKTMKTPSFLYPNTTTLIEIILNRRQSDQLMTVRQPLLE